VFVSRSRIAGIFAVGRVVKKKLKFMCSHLQANGPLAVPVLHVHRQMNWIPLSFISLERNFFHIWTLIFL
jgi:hypothetical protein